MICKVAALALISLLASPTLAQQVATRAQLEAILEDQITMEDFENFSIPSGKWILLPNPATAANSNNALQQGLTFSAENSLILYAGFIFNKDNLYLSADRNLTIEFDQPQIAVGFDLFTAPEHTITIRTRDGSIIEQLTTTNPPIFFGYVNSTQGIASITINRPAGDGISLNDLTYGANFIPCPADLNNDNNQDFLDISAFITFFVEEDDRADFNDDGQFDFLDISAFITALTTACP